MIKFSSSSLIPFAPLLGQHSLARREASPLGSFADAGSDRFARDLKLHFRTQLSIMLSD